MNAQDVPDRKALKEPFLSRLTSSMRAVGVFWPAVLLVLLLATLCCFVEAGRDVVLLARQRPWTMPLVLIAAVFAAFTTWYSSRLVGFCFLRVLANARAVSRHLPRFLGFSVFTVMAFALTLPPVADLGAVHGGWFILVLVVSFPWYRALVAFANGYASKHRQALSARRGLAFAMAGLLLACLASALVGDSAWALVACALAAQFFYTVQVAARRPWAPMLAVSSSLPVRLLRLRPVRRIVERARQYLHAQGLPDPDRPKLAEEAVYFAAFNLIAAVGLGLFMAANANLSFAQVCGPLPLAILGLSIQLGGINLIRAFGRVQNVNMAFWLLAIALVAGRFSDAHSVRLTNTAPATAPAARPPFTTAAKTWMQLRVDSAMRHGWRPGQEPIPMVFVLCDGGGARSARWVTDVLGQMDSLSNGGFRQHLFTLSGASGGSVGNLVYHALLQRGVAPERIGQEADLVTGADLLSFTVARWMGSDLLNLLFPPLGDTLVGDWRPLEDRAAGVEDALIRAGRIARLALDTPMATGFAQHLPLLCINTTRVQDARPAVIASFNLTGDSAFSGRLDVLAGLPAGSAISMAASAVLSARFPYVTPGGSVPQRTCDDHGQCTGLRSDLFVDGGYFDNSGAGLVKEMLVELECSQELWPLYQWFRPVVLHISNGDPGPTEPQRVNSVVNDLLAPVQTIVGAYGQQTDVNNQQLARYLANHQEAWVEINLFRERTKNERPEYYPMSWMMSQAPADSMRQRARSHPAVAFWANKLKKHVP